MKYRKLRIAWSVACGIMCLLLVVLWVRSYWRQDSAGCRISAKHFLVSSYRGKLEMLTRDFPVALGSPRLSWRSFSANYVPDAPTTWYFDTWVHTQLSGIVWVPYWLPTLITGAMAAAAPLIRWRFGLRTLLIGMTLIAILLGVIVYAAR